MSYRNVLDERIDKLDTADVVSMFAVVLGAAAVCGFAVIEIAGYNLTGVMHTFGTSTEVSYGLAGIFGGLIWAVVTNGFDRETFFDLSDGEKVAIGTVLVGAVVYTMSPDMASFIEATTFRQAAYTGLHGVAVVVLASE